MDCQRFVFSTDWHVTNNWPISRRDNFLETIYGKIDWVVDFANKHDAYLVLGGDLVDKYNTKSRVINTLIKKLRRANKQVFGIIGNHDIYGQNSEVIDDVPIGSLFFSGVIELLDRDPIFINENRITTQLTGVNYLPNMETNKEIYYVKKHKDVDQAIHVVHGFLVTKHWPTLRKNSYTVISEVITEADVICTGHEHQGFGIKVQDNTLYTNPGSLGRISSNIREINRMPKVTLLTVYKDYVKGELYDVPAEPGNRVLSRKHIEEEKARKQALEEFSINLVNERETCNLEDIFTEQVKIHKVDKEVRDLSWKAILEYEKRQTGR